MANIDIKEWQIGENTYKFKDETARQELATKQDALTLDSSPTNGSNNPVKSSGIYSALATKADQTTTYTKTEVNNLIVPANTEIIVISDVSELPDPGTANTIYRVAGDDSYTDYGWDGTDWIELATYNGTNLYSTTGHKTDGAMTQKAVTDSLIERWISAPYKCIENLVGSATHLNETGTYVSRNSSYNYVLAYLRVNAGEIVNIRYNNLIGGVYAYISSDIPAVDVPCTLIYGKNYNSENPETTLDVSLAMTANGYLGVVTKATSNTNMPDLYKAVMVKQEMLDVEENSTAKSVLDITDLDEISFNITQFNKWAVSSGNTKGKVVGITSGKRYIITSSLKACVGILKTNTSIIGSSAVNFSDDYPGRLIVDNGTKFVFTAPLDAHYIYIQTILSNGDETGITISEADTLEDVMDAVYATDEKIKDIEAQTSQLVSKFNVLKGIESIQALDHLVLNTDGTTSQSVKSNFYVDKFPISGAKLLYVTGRAANGVTFPDACLCCIFDENDNLLRYYEPNGSKPSTTYTDLLIYIPENAAYILVNSSHNHAVGVKAIVNDCTTIHPLLERGAIHPTNGGLTEQQSAAGGASLDAFMHIRTSKFIDIHYNAYGSVVIESSITCRCRMVYYNSEYIRIGDSEYLELTGGVPQTIVLPNVYYIKFYFVRGSRAENIRVPMFNFQITGLFDANWEKYNVRSADDGYQTVAVQIPVINGGTCNEETNTVQDVTTFGIDFGLLALPESYTNEGNPTRLIIYCHGAGTNYSKNITRFPDEVLLPEYFLSEGYAILDMDGECYAAYDTQHTYIPESLQCYLAAYKWVVKNYNICKDGIFLAGRSMGGGMCFSILNCGQIPVIAACPVVPVTNTLWWWSYMVSNYRERFATRAGFVGTQPTWGSQQPLTTAEQNYLKANFDALRRWSPLWRCIVDLPTDPDVLFDSSMMVDRHETDVPEEVALYGSLHAKAKCPIKMFANYSDQSVPYERNAMLMHKMLLNGGQEVELRMFEVENDQDTSRTAHYFEMRDDRLVPWTNSKGVEMNVSIVYIEMLAFWRRYE